MGTLLKFAIAAIAFILAAPLATGAFAESRAIIVDPAAAVSDKRVALVIGNASYGQKSENGIIVPDLVNPLNDARAIRDTLTKLGFRIVYGENLTKKQLEHAIGTFANLVEDADVAITYFSGHGSTFGDVPYLVPVDAEFDSLEAIPHELVKVEDFIGELRRVKGVRIALIDACRDNDADQALKSAARTKGVGQTKGLARVANPDGLIIVYATQFLTTAADGDAGNSPFAAALVQHLPTPGEDVKNVLFDVASDVVSRTKGEQRPEVSVSLFDSFTLNPGAPAASSPPVAAPPASAEVVFWNSILNSTNRADFRAYLKNYPEGTFVDLAHNRIASLEPAPSPRSVPATTSVCDGGLVASVGDAGVAAAADRCLKPKVTFRDCENCPEMVVVPAGSFTMGSSDNENARDADEGPQHEVTFAKPFTVGKFAVTFDEWDACVSDGGCYRPDDNSWGRGQRPVINVSWDDAKAYVAWLSRKTGKPYRLLTEAEREYVTRAGTTTPYWWGASISEHQANYNSGSDKTVPVDSFKANPFGLYNVHGNVWEWLEDCWHDSYAGAPKDGSAWTTGSCELRALRGGAWYDGPWILRAADRFRGPPVNRLGSLGFRVARTLTP